MYNILSTLCTYAYVCLRPLIKWFLRKTTCLCEIQRICYGNEKGASRARALDYSLRHSRYKEIQALVEQLDTFCMNRRLQGTNGNAIVEFSASALIKVKRIKLYKDLQYPLTVCLAQIFGYKQLVQEVEQVRNVQYSSDDVQHEEKLMKLWHYLMPDTALEARISKQWGEIGFQGDDPKTDFRGMGLLGLENLLFFATRYTGAARHVLSHSHHSQYGYSFAIVGINLTSMAYELLVNNLLQTHMYNAVPGRPSLKHFHQVYVYLFYEFDKLWLSEKPRDIMEFSRIRDLFHQKISKILKDDKGILRLNFAIETV